MKTLKFKNRMNSIAKVLVIFTLLACLVSCGNGKKMKISDFNYETNTFSFTDTKSGAKIFYNTLMIGDQKVVDTQCMGGAQAVVFAFDNNTIVRSGGSVSINGGKAYTLHAELVYKLENGVLTILDVK